MHRRIRVLVALVVVGLLAVVGARPGAAQDVPPTWSLSDGTGEVGDRTADVERQLAALAAEGWHLHIVLLGRPGPIGDTTALVPPLPAAPTPEVADRTLSMVMTEGAPRDWLITGSGGTEPVGQAAFAFPEVSDRTEERLQDGEDPTQAFVSSVAAVAGSDVGPAGGVTPTVDDPPGLLHLMATLVALVAGGGTLVFLVHVFRTRGTGPKVRSVSGLAPGTNVTVEGTVRCSAPFGVPEAGVAAVHARWVHQEKHSSTSVGRETRLDRRTMREVDVSVERVNEGFWRDTRVDRAHTVPFFVDDGTGAVRVQGQGTFESDVVYEGPSRARGSIAGGRGPSSESRDVVYAIPLGAQVAVQGHVYQDHDGSLVVAQGTARGQTKLEVTTKGSSLGFASRRLVATLGVLIVGGGTTLAALWAMSRLG